MPSVNRVINKAGILYKKCLVSNIHFALCGCTIAIPLAFFNIPDKVILFSYSLHLRSETNKNTKIKTNQ